MEVTIDASWKKVLCEEFEKPYFRILSLFVRDSYVQRPTYPPPKDIFRAFDLCPFDQVRVVILGQDPYHGPGQANGLCFAVGEGARLPPSLKNIYKEIHDDVGGEMHTEGDLERWACQGVLLLNATLTVERGSPGSHQGKGWEEFTDAVVRVLNDEKERLVFILWGNYAKQKGAHIDREKHLVLEAAHPSPFSAHSGFFGCRHFSKANKYLDEHGKPVIHW